MWSVVTLHSVLPSECNISANVAYWDSVCARRQYLEPHFPQLHPQTPWALPVAASLMHNPKAGGSTLKRILRNLASAHNLTVCGVPAQYHIPVAATELTPAEQQACRISFTTPGSTFEVANLTRRPTILLTTLRPPVDHYVSAYNYVCVWNNVWTVMLTLAATSSFRGSREIAREPERQRIAVMLTARFHFMCILTHTISFAPVRTVTNAPHSHLMCLYGHRRSPNQPSHAVQARVHVPSVAARPSRASYASSDIRMTYHDPVGASVSMLYSSCCKSCAWSSSSYSTM